MKSLLMTMLRRWEDPLVQVWMMGGLAFLLVLTAHLRAWRSGGEGKLPDNTSAPQLLLAGAALTWTDGFGPFQNAGDRPQLVIPPPPSIPSTETGSGASQSAPVSGSIDIPAAMQDAAARPYHELDRPLRHLIQKAPFSPGPLQVKVLWSGDARGNAALANRVLPAPPTGISPFVIGNGSRSRDGGIALSSGTCDFSGGKVQVVLIGDGLEATAAQTAALGELLNFIEAVHGQRLLLTHPDQIPAG